MSNKDGGPDARLDKLESVEAIQALKARYWRAIDGRSPDDVESCLTVDVRVDFEGLPAFSSRTSFMEMIRAAADQPGHHMHHGRNPVIRMTGPDTAEGVWDIFYQGLFKDAGQMIQMVGLYDDQYRREADGWRIAAMTMRQRSFITRGVGDDRVPRFTALPGEDRLTSDTL